MTTTPSEAVRVAVQALRDAMLKIADKIEGNHIISGSPGPLFNMGWSEANGMAAGMLRDALSLHVGDAVDAQSDVGATPAGSGSAAYRPEPQSVSALRAPIPGAETEGLEAKRAAFLADKSPGSPYHLTLLMAPHHLNLVVGDDRAALLAWGRDVWQAARAALARGIDSGEVGETEGLDPEGARARPEGARPVTAVEHGVLQRALLRSTKIVPNAPTTPTEGPAQPERRFPMQRGPSIPWSLAEAIYAGYAAQYGTQQSLQRLGERGGFSWKEVEVIYADKRGKVAIDGAIESKVRAGTLTDPEGAS